MLVSRAYDGMEKLFLVSAVCTHTWYVHETQSSNMCIVFICILYALSIHRALHCRMFNDSVLVPLLNYILSCLSNALNWKRIAAAKQWTHSKCLFVDVALSALLNLLRVKEKLLKVPRRNGSISSEISSVNRRCSSS